MKAGRLLVDFSSPRIRASARKRGVAAFTALDEDGRPVGMEVFLSALRPEGIVLEVPRDIKTGDWTGFQELAFDLENRGPSAVKVGIGLLNDRGRGRFDRMAEFSVEVPAGIRSVWRIPIQQLRYSRGWWSPWGIPRQPPLGDARFRGLMDSKRIRKVRLFLAQGRQVAALAFYRLSLRNPISSTRWVDKYGQRSGMYWPGKVRKDRDIVRADAKEERDLARPRSFPERDEYQACRRFKVRRPTGFFRVEQVDGRWWFVAPNGRLYYACGMDVVICGIDARMDPVVKAAYSWLPGKKGRFGAAWGERGGMSLYRANLIRKWGAADFRRRFLVRALRRQLAWGFTSIGNWSAPEQFALRRMPYFSVGPDTGAMKVPYAAKKIHDAFHSDFEKEAVRAAAGLSAGSRDPFLVGHFVDNEVDWAGLPSAVAGSRTASPARIRLIGRLRRRYGSISRLNRAWGAGFASFSALKWPAAGGGLSRAAERDLSDFRGEFADRWFGIWAKAVRLADPNHLVLGSRLHQGNRPPEVIAACAKHMDVVSMNHYEIGADAREFAGYYRIAKKPLLIGEYGHNSLDAGLLTAAVPVADQAARATGYRYYTEGLAAQPYFVGGHFFQYLDEPITGRFDRETAFNGFVNIADIPYPRMVQAAKASHARIYAVHAGLLKPFSAGPKL